jgi:two-component system response regulator QseB
VDGLAEMRILLAEDDQMIGESLCKALRQFGYTIDWMHDGQSADNALQSTQYDLVLLDLGLPRKSGIDLLIALRRRSDSTPVLVLTARDAIADRVAGLDAGGDDYLIKPFDLDELEARIRALLRRQSGRTDTVMRCGDLCLNPANHEVTLKGAKVALSAREFSLLQTLLDRPGLVLSRSQLEEKLYGWDDEIGSNTVEVYIHSLRKKLGADLIKNVRGVGYMVCK